MARRSRRSRLWYVGWFVICLGLAPLLDAALLVRINHMLEPARTALQLFLDVWVWAIGGTLVTAAGMLVVLGTSLQPARQTWRSPYR